MQTKKLTATQMDVLRMACTHGDTSQGLRTQSDYGGRACTLLSLRKLGLLDAMSAPTDAGQAAHATGRCAAPPPSTLARLRKAARLKPPNVIYTTPVA